jgi:vacuolar-type H+-ATPase subunit I/STV1
MKSIISSLLLIGLLSCNGGSKSYDRAMPVMAEGTAKLEADQQPVNSPEVITERKVIKTGEISFQTKSIQETTSFIKQNVNELKGYISSENVYNSDDRMTQRMEIRVPSDSFDDLLSRISENARKIDSKNVRLQDVTEEYIDVESRIKTKKELETRYRELLSKAKTVEEILSIEKELGTLRSDIESVEGRLKYLKDQVSLSTLSVEYYEMTRSTLNFSSRIGQAIVSGWRYLLAFIIGLVNLWPFILIIVAVIVTALRISKRKSKKM